MLFMTTKPDAKRIKLLQINKNCTEITSVLMGKAHFCLFSTSKFELFDLKSKVQINEFPLHNRSYNNQLHGAIPLCVGDVAPDLENLTFLAVSTRQLQVYAGGILKMERLTPGRADYIGFGEAEITRYFDYNLRFSTVDLRSQRVLC